MQVHIYRTALKPMNRLSLQLVDLVFYVALIATGLMSEIPTFQAFLVEGCELWIYTVILHVLGSEIEQVLCMPITAKLGFNLCRPIWRGSSFQRPHFHILPRYLLQQCCLCLMK